MLGDLKSWGLSAILVTVGAEDMKSLIRALALGLTLKLLLLRSQTKSGTKTVWFGLQ